MRKKFRTTIIVGMLTTVGVVSANPAQASQWNDISGITFADPNQYFVSDYVRSVTSDNVTIKAYTVDLPNGGLDIFLQDNNTGNRFGSVLYFGSNNVEKNFATGVKTGTKFRNVFKKRSTGDDNRWSGRQFY